MEHINVAKITIFGIIGAIGAFVSSLFGGWDSALTTLLIFMAIDYASGLAVAGIFQRSGKSESGALESRAGWKGLCRKGMTLLFVLVAVRIDILVGTDFAKDATIIGFVINESLSIAENAGLMGVPLPGALRQAIEILRKKGSVKIE